jgi:hypothetical protein
MARQLKKAITVGIMASGLFPAYHRSPRITCWVRSGILDLVNDRDCITGLPDRGVHMNARDGIIAGSKLVSPRTCSGINITFSPIETIYRANVTIVFRKQLLY